MILRRRLRAWDTALAAWARSVMGQPFAWGQTDCASLVRGALRAMYGVDPTTLAWTTEAEALRAAAASGGADVVLPALGAKRVAGVPVTAWARSGDVWVADPDPPDVLAYCGVVLFDQVLTVRVGGVVAARTLALTPGPCRLWRFP